MKDPNLIYPGSDLTNVFPEEGMDGPTQAQREAAAKAIAYELNLTHSDIAPHIDRAAKAALTAAAEVPPLLDQRALREAAIDATIERCAAVAEQIWPSSVQRAAIAAAIRALKDKP